MLLKFLTLMPREVAVYRELLANLQGGLCPGVVAQERPPLAPEFGSMALGTPRKPTLALPSSGAPALPRTLAAEWPQGARLPAERAHERIPNLQPPTGSAFCPVHAPS